MSAALQSQGKNNKKTQNKTKQKADRWREGGWREAGMDGGREGRPRERVGKSTLCPSVVFLAWDRVNLAHRICNEPLLFVTDIAPGPPCCLHLFSSNECRGNGENSGGRPSCTVGRDGKKEFLEFSETKSIQFKSAKVEEIRNPCFHWRRTVSCF